MQQYQEGMTATGPNGETAVFRGGQWVVAPAASPVTLGTPDPYTAQNHVLSIQRQRLEIQQLKDKLAADQNNQPMSPIGPTSKLHGDKFLATLPPSIQGQVKGLSTGQIPFPSSFALKSPYWQNLLQAVVNYDPSFDAVNYQARAATRKDFTAGKDAANVTALNTALGHAGSLMDAASNLNNFGGVASNLNPARNWVLQHSGDGRVDAYNVNKQAFASEMERVFRGTGGSLQGIKDWEDSLSAANSPAQFKAVMGKAAELLKSRIDALNQQYRNGMGTTANITDLLTPEAQEAYGKLYDGTGNVHVMFGGVNGQAGGANPPSGGGSSGGMDTPPPAPPMPSAGGGSLATGATKNGYNKAASDLINRYVRDPSKNFGDLVQALGPMGFGPNNPQEMVALQRQFANARSYAKAHPNYPGSYGNAVTPPQPTTFFERQAAGPVGAFASSFANAATGNNLDSIAGLAGNDPANVRAGLSALSSANPWSSALGDVAGALPLAAGFEAGTGAALGKMGADGLIKYAPLIGDAAYGAFNGAGASDGNRVGGAIEGGALGLGGGMFGRALARPIAALSRTAPVNAVVNGARRAFNKPELAIPQAPSAAENMIFGAANKAGIPDIQAQLSEAQRLGVPMSLADTNPNLRELGAAAVRRSPTASQVAENALLPRGRGQIDRFTQSVEQNLGPIGNVPKIAEDLTAQARNAAGPLYDQAYSQPAQTSPRIDQLLQTPFGRQAVARASTIAANEGRNPAELGLSIDQNGNALVNGVPIETVGNHMAAREELNAAQAAYKAARSGNGDVSAALQRVEAARSALRTAEQQIAATPAQGTARQVTAYTPQTIDYIKRGMDDVLEQYRNPITGRLQLDEAGRAQNAVKNDLLSEADRLNPFYAQARSTYAGPVQARDAMASGQDAFRLPPNTVGQMVSAQSDGNMPLFQLGYRDALMNKANSAGYSTNPFNSTIGSPMAEQRLRTVFPNTPGVDTLLRQRDLEGQLARNTNDILGNSKTAQRGIADQQFAGEDWPQLALDAGINLATGQVPTSLLIKKGSGQALKDALKMGIGKNAVARADEIAPILFNTDPQASAASLSNLADNLQAYRDFVAAQRRKAAPILGMFGASGASAIGSGF